MEAFLSVFRPGGMFTKAEGGDYHYEIGWGGKYFNKSYRDGLVSCLVCNPSYVLPLKYDQ